MKKLLIAHKYKISVLLVLAMFFLYNGLTYSNVFNTGTVYIDLNNKTYTQRSMSGFLHTFNNDKLEDISNDLEPAYWRIGGDWIKTTEQRNKVIDSFISRGIKPILILSSPYKYKRMNIKGWVDPSDNAQPFLNLVKKLYLEQGNRVIYDVWNEPDHRNYWQESDTSFFILFKKVHNLIRSLPNGQSASITGPSTAGLNKDYLSRFIKFCSDNNIRLDYLNWHYMAAINNSASLDKFNREIASVKKIMFQYPNVGIKSIILPEIIGEAQQYSPKAPILFFKTLEENDIEGSCKACWNNSKGINNCFNNSLDGLFTEDGQTRSVWWAYQLYAKSLKFRLKSVTDNNLIASTCSLNKDQDTLTVLLVNTSNNNQLTCNLRIKNINNLKLKNKSTVVLSLFEIPDTSESPLEKPNLIYTSNLKYEDIQNYKVNAKLNNTSLYFIQIH